MSSFQHIEVNTNLQYFFSISQAIKYLEKLINEAEKQKEKQEKIEDGMSAIKIEDERTDLLNSESRKEISIDPKTYCKLGHFYLLLEDYNKGNNFSILNYQNDER